MKKILSISLIIIVVIANATNIIQNTDFEDFPNITLKSLLSVAHADLEAGNGWIQDQIDESGLCYDCAYFMGTYVEKICDCYRITIFCDPGPYPDCTESQRVDIDYISCTETGYAC